MSMFQLKQYLEKGGKLTHNKIRFIGNKYENKHRVRSNIPHISILRGYTVHKIYNSYNGIAEI